MKKSYMPIQLNITDSLSGQKKAFIASDTSKHHVSLYVCGITPYDYSHIGHGRCYVTFDLLYRLLTFLGYNVTYARNYTDIDDKLIIRAERELSDSTRYLELADRFIAAYQEDMAQLNCLTPQHEPRVTQHIDAIITFIKGLISANKAYVANGDVYYRINSFASYGELSKRNVDDLIAGARAEIRDDKENPLDFALWKATAAQPGWQSPWGLGRPGWHIECSTLAKEYLGDTIDIHGGGMDLIFPHHENERAQSEGLTNKTFVRYWLHNAFVNVNKEKMSKSLGNFVVLRHLLDLFDPMVVRYYYLVHHYRNPLEFSESDIHAVTKSYQKICSFFSQIPAATHKSISDDMLAMPIVVQFIEALCDDLNVAKAIGILFEQLSELKHDQKQAASIKALLQHVLGLRLESIELKKQWSVEEQRVIDELIAQRQEARAAKDWVKADILRDRLRKLGYQVQDTKA